MEANVCCVLDDDTLRAEIRGIRDSKHKTPQPRDAAILFTDERDEQARTIWDACAAVTSWYVTAYKI